MFDLGKPESRCSPSTHYAKAYYTDREDLPLALEMLEPEFNQIVYECLTSAIYERFGLTPIDVLQLDRVQYTILMKHIQEYNKVLQDKQNDISKSFEKEKNKIILPSEFKSSRRP